MTVLYLCSCNHEFRHKEAMKVLFFLFIFAKPSDDYQRSREAIVSILKENENDYSRRYKAHFSVYVTCDHL